MKWEYHRQLPPLPRTLRFLFFEILTLSVFTSFGIWSIIVTPNLPVAYMISGEWGATPI